MTPFNFNLTNESAVKASSCLYRKAADKSRPNRSVQQKPSEVERCSITQ